MTERLEKPNIKAQIKKRIASYVKGEKKKALRLKEQKIEELKERARIKEENRKKAELDEKHAIEVKKNKKKAQDDKMKPKREVAQKKKHDIMRRESTLHDVFDLTKKRPTTWTDEDINKVMEKAVEVMAEEDKVLSQQLYAQYLDMLLTLLSRKEARI